MSDDTATSASEGVTLLEEVSTLRQRVRADRHAYWFPLMLFGVLSLAAAPLYLSRPVRTGQSFSWSAGEIAGLAGPAEHGRILGWYWLVALTGGYLLCALWYRRHARRVGVQTPTRAYAIVGLVGVVLAVAVPFVPFLGLLLLFPWIRGTTAPLIIAVGLLVLARVERSRQLAVIALIYTGVVVLVSLYNVENLVYRLWYPGSWLSSQIGDLWGTIFLAPVLLVGGIVALVTSRKKVPA